MILLKVFFDEKIRNFTYIIIYGMHDGISKQKTEKNHCKKSMQLIRL